MSDSNFQTLEAKVDDLIQLCAEMKVENQMLRNKEDNWKSERDSLIGKNQLARVSLEKVLGRLKALEQG